MFHQWVYMLPDLITVCPETLGKSKRLLLLQAPKKRSKAGLIMFIDDPDLERIGGENLLRFRRKLGEAFIWLDHAQCRILSQTECGESIAEKFQNARKALLTIGHPIPVLF